MRELDSRYISRAKRVVREQFPEMADVEPTLSMRKASGKGAGASAPYVLTFRKGIPLEGGERLVRTVRVTLNEAGEIVKIASSK